MGLDKFNYLDSRLLYFYLGEFIEYILINIIFTNFYL